MNKSLLVKRTLKWTLFILLTLLLLICLVLTPWGSQTLLTWYSSQQQAIQIHIQEGGLINPKGLDIDFNQQNISLHIRDASFQLQVAFVNDVIPSLILNDFHAQEVRLTMDEDLPSSKSSPERVAESSDNQPLLPLPVPIELHNFSIESIMLDMPGTKINLAKMIMSAEAKAEQIQIDSLQLFDLKVAVEAQSSPAEQSIPDAIPALKPVSWPFAWSVLLDQFILRDAALTQESPDSDNSTTQTLDQLTFSAAMTPEHMQVSDLNLNSSQLNGQLNAVVRAEQGSVVLNENLLELSALAEFADYRLTIQSEGNWQNLTFNAAAVENQPAQSAQSIQPQSFKSSIKGHVDLTSTNFPFDASLKVSDLTLMLEQKQMSNIHMQLRAAGHADNYSIQSLVAVTEPNRTIHWSEQQDSLATKIDPLQDLILEGQVEGNLSELSAIGLSAQHHGLFSTIQGQVNWQQPLEALFNWQIDQLDSNLWSQTLIQPWAQHSNIAVPEVALAGGLSARLTSNDAVQVKVETLDLKGQYLKTPISISGNGHYDSAGESVIDRLQIKSGDNDLHLSGEVSENWSLNAELNLVEASQLLPDMAGQGAMSVTVTGEKAQPQITLNGHLKQFQFDLLQISALEVDAKINTDLQQNSQLLLSMGHAEINGQTINATEVNFQGNQVSQTMELDLHSPILTLRMAGSGRATFEQGQALTNLVSWQGQLDNSLINLLDRTWQPDKTIEMSWNQTKQIASLSAHCWLADGTQSGTMCLQAIQADAQRGEVSLDWRQLPIQYLADIAGHFNPEAFNNIQLAGLVAGLAELEWRDNQFEHLNAGLNFTQAELNILTEQGQLTLPINQLEAKLFSQAQHADVNFKLGFKQANQIQGSAQLSGFSTDPQIKARIGVHQLDLHQLTPLVAHQLQHETHLQGNLAADIQLAGDLYQPDLTGFLNLSDIQITAENLPIQLQGMQMSAQFNQRAMQVSGALKTKSVRQPTRPLGRAEFEGQLDWSQQALLVDLALKGQGIEVSPSPELFVFISPDLNVSQKNSAFNVSGRVSVDEGMFKIDTLPQTAVQPSRDLKILDQPDQSAKSAPQALAMAVELSIDERMRIEALGLKSNLKGELSLTQQPGTPLIAVGKMDLLAGEYRAFGQDLLIEQGTVSFQGPINKPGLQIQAYRDPNTVADDVIAGVRVTGSPSQPEVAIYSQPAMEQGQALSYLLRGKKLGAGGDPNAALGTVLLSGSLKRGQKVLKKVGERLGLKQVEVSSAGSGDTMAVEISGYVNDKTQIKYSMGVFDSTSEVAVKYELIPKLYLEAVSGLVQSLDVVYQFDY